MEKFQNKLTKIAGDASFRQFYRLKKGKKTSIIVKAKKEKFKNLVLYSAINKFLRQRIEINFNELLLRRLLMTIFLLKMELT